MYMQGSTVIIAKKGGLVQSIDKGFRAAALRALPSPCLYLCLRVLHAFDHSSHCGILGVLLSWRQFIRHIVVTGLLVGWLADGAVNVQG